MKPKNILVFTLIILGAAAGYSQSQSITLNSVPSRSMGQPQLFPESGSINRVEGRELYDPQGVAVDTSTPVPAVYVSDFRNNRVLAWKNAAGFSNGAPADLVIGQPDFFNTNQQGPASAFPSGLTAPTGIVVDSKGNLYVVDNGNNRILRYPQPFNQQQVPVNPDLWLGQPNLNTRNANYTGGVSAAGLFLSNSGSIYQANLAFDSSGNLWAVDAGNSRVIRFPAASLSCSNCTAQADIVVGQTSLTTTQTPALQNNAAGIVITNQFGSPAAVAFDSKGRLYVADAIGSQGRVLVFSNPSAQVSAASADRIMGVVQSNQLTGLSQDQLNLIVGQTLLFNPTGLFVLPDNSVGVVDTGFNRILIYPPFEQWPAVTTYFSPQAASVVGQRAFPYQTNSNPNGISTGSTIITPRPSSTSLWNPVTAAYLAPTKELFVADSSNNRVVVLPQSGTTFTGATRVLGQDRMSQYSPNLVEGKEFDFQIAPPYANANSVDAGMALDTTGPTPHLWVADPYNHRVLGFKDARTITPSSRADIVLGQPDLATTLCNYPSGDPASPTQSSLCRPYGVAVDAKGNLFVADSANGRVLRFPNPFASGTSALQQADVVLGQSSFTASLRQPSATTMGAPYGLAFSGANGLVVSDLQYNRVVYIPFTNGTFTSSDNGKAATRVFGQTNFTSGTNFGDLALNHLNAPHHVACDTNGLVYVTDTGNNRILIFGDPSNSQTSSFATLQLTGLNQPRGIYVNAGTGEIWVTNSNSGTLVRYPKYDTVQFNPTPTATIQNVVNNTLIPTLAVAQDQYGDLFVADTDNRVAVYYQGFAAVNAATSLVRPLAPGMMATLYPVASATQFGANTATAGGTTWPTTLGDIQVTFNGTPAPLYYVSPGQINFYVPMGAPTNSNAEVEVIQASTGQVLGALQVGINTVAPGVYTSCQANQTGALREACVLNQDNTINSASNPAPRGSVVQVFGTGQGLVSNAPADGAPAPGSAPLATTVAQPRVLMNTCFVDDCGAPQPGDVGTSTSATGSWVSFSGLAPNFVGLWQVNVQIPMAITPGQALIDIVVNGVASWDTTSGFKTYFYVK